MKETVLHVQMLGELTLTLDGNTISESQNRTRKMWALMAYLLYHRNRVVSRDELLELLWGNGNGHNPVSAMKTALHRTRALLDGLYPGAGHDMILQKRDGYCWNTAIPMELDIDTFQSLCLTTENTAEDSLDSWSKALDLYHGNFLSRMSSELWILPVATYYQNLYIQTAEKALPLLKKKHVPEQISELCQKVLLIDPYNESIYRYLIQSKIDQGDQKAAMSVYEDLSRRLAADFGVIPEEATRSLYREAMQTIGEQFLPPELVQRHLREEEGLAGAMLCDYSFFKMLCFAQSRSMIRQDIEAHIGLFSLTDRHGNSMSKHSLDQSMKQLEFQLQTGLRRGDAVAKCSSSQYIILLPYANYHNSCMVCERIIQSYFSSNPQSSAAIQYWVHELEPYE